VSATGTIAAEPNTCRSDPRRVFPLPSGGAVLLESSEGMTTHLDGKRIAIVKMSAIGDVVEVLPVVRSIRAAAPDAHLTWIIQRVPHELVAPIGAADEFILFDRGGGLGAYRDLRRRTRDRRWDIVLDLQVALKAGIATAMLRAPRKIGFDRARSSDLNWLFTNERIPARPPAHRQDQYLEFVDHLGIPRVVNWGLGSTPAEREAFAGLLPADTRPTVGLVLASTGEDRNWGADRYVELVGLLTQCLGARVVLLGAPSAAENRVAEVIARSCSAQPLDLRAWDLRRLVYLLERMDAVVAPDTGPMHIAVAAGTPTVALFGYTNPRRAGPYRFRHLTIDAFGDPGEDYDASARYRAGRMERITAEQVLEKVELALERREQGTGNREQGTGNREQGTVAERSEERGQGGGGGG
jgi:heptosyltransferase I